jgi:hypothetical protein
MQSSVAGIATPLLTYLDARGEKDSPTACRHETGNTGITTCHRFLDQAGRRQRASRSRRTLYARSKGRETWSSARRHLPTSTLPICLDAQIDLPWSERGLYRRSIGSLRHGEAMPAEDFQVSSRGWKGRDHRPWPGWREMQPGFPKACL